MLNFDRPFFKNVIPVVLLFIIMAAFLYLFKDKTIYFDELLNGLLGVAIVVTCTAAIIGYQYSIEGNDRKKQLVYEKKIEAFKNVASVLRPLIIKQKVSKDSIYELLALRLEVLLICGPKSFNNFQILLDEVQDFMHSKGNDKAEDKLQIAILELFSSFAKELMEERGVSNNEKNQMNNILDNISQTDVINEFNRGMEKRTHRSNEEKLEILTSFVNAKKEDLSALNKKYKFTDIRVRVKLFRNQLLKKGFKEQLIERGISINDSENPKVGSNINK